VGKVLKYRVLQLFTFSLLVLSSFFLFNACNKDSLENHEFSNISQLKKFNWSLKENKFFSFQNKALKEKSRIDLRNIIDSLPPLLVEAYNQIAEENESYNFVDDLTDAVGIPFWTFSYVYQKDDMSGGLVMIPFGFENGDNVNAILVGTK
jgi:hypothetical protein